MSGPTEVLSISPTATDVIDFQSKLFVKPFSWSSFDPSPTDIKSNPSLIPSIQIFGYTPTGKTVYARIPRKSTFVLKFTEDIDNDIITNIIDILNPSTVSISDLDPKILIVRAPELSPIELTANPNSENIATWTNVKQDPYGELESLWEAKEIGPYEWLSINKFAPLPGKYTNADLNIITDESHISISSEEELRNLYQTQYLTVSPRLFFWNMETLASKGREFPNSSDPDDKIFIISIITVSSQGTNNYVIVNGLNPNINSDQINKLSENLVLIRAKDEKDLISQFFAIYNIFKPDRQIYYNGDMSSMPYLLDRLNLYNLTIPKISKILSLVPKTISHYYPTPFGREMARTIKLPGTEIIDLIHYYRRFYSNIGDHRLDTVTKYFLKENITNPFAGITGGQSSELSKIIEYSFTNTIHMHQLWIDTYIQSKLENVCNNLGISIDILLRESFDHIINLAVYNIDAGSVLIGGSNGTPTHLKEAVSGIYRDVYIYDYSELYRTIMLNSNQQIASVLAERLENAPSQLILTAFYSKYVDRTDLLPILTSMLENVIGTKSVITLESTIIRSISPLDASWLNLIQQASSYVAVAKASHITVGVDGALETAGLSKLCRPKFQLAADTIYQYLMYIYSDEFDQFPIPDLKSLPIEKFVLTEKIGDIMTLPPDSLKYKLAAQYPAPITTWVTVKYIMTIRGPVILPAISQTDVIDYNYYLNELENYIKDLQSLKIYGI